MAKTGIQCPDSGLTVVIAWNPISRLCTVRGDQSDWEEMQADGDTISATEVWIAWANRNVKGKRLTVREIEKLLNIEVPELTWGDA